MENHSKQVRNPTFSIYVLGYYLVSHVFFSSGEIYGHCAVAQIAMSGDWGKAQAPDRLAAHVQIELTQ